MKSDDRGYIMVALLIGMTIAAIWMAATLPAWRQQSVREKEEELIFRGTQYARAIGLFYRKNNRSLPTDIDALVSGKYLRKKWKDPITGDDFAMIGQTPQPVGGATPQGNLPGLPTGNNRAGAPATLSPGRAPSSSLGSPVPSSLQGQYGIGGIYGVASKSTATSIKIYNNQQQYNLWQFTLQSSNIAGFNQRQGTPAGTGRDTGPGRGQQPGGGPLGPGRGGLPGGRGPGGLQPPGPPGAPPGGRGRGGD